MHKVFGMISLGCDKNRVDGERLLGEVRRHGCPITDDPYKAQVLIVNTCAFLNAAREEAIKAVIESDLLRTGALEKIVVAGCLPQKFISELFPALTEGDVFLGVADCSELFPALERAYSGERVNAVGRGKEGSERVITTPPHIKYLKIADGCFNHCTYCLIPAIRGRYRSYPMEQLISEAKGLGETQELVLVAQDTTRYGEDTGKNLFVELLQKLSELDNICHIRLLYCYPEVVTDELIRELRDNPKLIKYLDIPLQHSEDRILKLMGRRGTRAEYLALFAKLRREVPDIALRSTFIAGFPGETEEEHKALMAFLREARIENCGFFAYSREEGTPAYKLPAQVHPRTKERRVRELYAVQEALSRGRLQGYIGQRVRVLCDGADFERGCFTGHTAFQAYDADGKVYFNAPQAETGKFYDVFVEGADEADLFGHRSDAED